MLQKRDFRNIAEGPLCALGAVLTPPYVGYATAPLFRANDFIHTSEIVLNIQSRARVSISVGTTKIIRDLKY